MVVAALCYGPCSSHNQLLPLLKNIAGRGGSIIMLDNFAQNSCNINFKFTYLKIRKSKTQDNCRETFYILRQLLVLILTILDILNNVN